MSLLVIVPVTVALLLPLLGFLLGRRLRGSLQARAESLVQARTAELRASEQALKAALEESRLASSRLRQDLEELRLSLKESEDRLQKNRSQLREQGRELESFSYSVSHDLRAPLRNINGFIEVLKKQYGDNLDARGRHYLEILSGESLRLGHLMESLVAFSRLSRTELRQAPVNLTELAMKARSALAQETEGREILWDIHLLPTVHADPDLLLRALTQLFSNAAKFTRGSNPAKIEFAGLSPGTDSGEQVFYVRDNGVGFDPKYTDKLFGAFQRLHKPADYEGTGMGLASVRRILAMHGGRVWAEGREGGGACFFFALPLPARHP